MHSIVLFNGLFADSVSKLTVDLYIPSLVLDRLGFELVIINLGLERPRPVCYFRAIIKITSWLKN